MAISVFSPSKMLFGLRVFQIFGFALSLLVDGRTGSVFSVLSGLSVSTHLKALGYGHSVHIQLMVLVAHNGK